MDKKLLLIFGIAGSFSLGAVGGIWAQAFLLPYLAVHAMFQDMQFVQEWAERTTVIREVREVTISQQEAVAWVVQQGQRAAVGVESTDGTTTLRGSGLVATADGFILTVADAVPPGYNISVYTQEGASGVPAQVLKRDAAKNLAILKIDQRNLSPVGFARQGSWRIGDTVVMVSRVVEGGELVVIAQHGTVRTENEGAIRTNMLDKPSLQGSPLFNMQGQVVGLNTFDAAGRLVAIPVSVLREFSGF